MSLFEDDDDVEEEPKGNQGPIINADSYPMRVLAGAGTGKTFTMVRKIERLLETEQTSPRSILALTFTNKAADSMRTKLNARIGSEGYDIDAYTYHSICHSILQDYPYYADLPSGFTIASDADKFALAQSAIEEVPYQFVNPDGSYRQSPEEVLLDFIGSMKQEGTSPEAIDEYLPSPDVLIDLRALTDRIESSARDHLRRQSLGQGGVQSFCDDLETFKMELQLEQRSLGSSPLEQDIESYLQQLIATVDTIKSRVQTESDALSSGSNQAAVRIPAVLFSGYGSEGARMTRKGDFPSGIPKLPFTLIDRLREYIDECQQASDFVHGYRAFERTRREAELVDFDDLIHETVALLDNEDIAAEIAGKWDYVFCDEFQDTDAVQFELVTRLAEHNRLFIVGDDDQAIYEWRGADSENIGSKLTETYASDLTDKELDLNFRSKQPILDLANDAITALEGRGSDKELTAYDEKHESTEGVSYIDTTPPDEDGAPDAEEYQADQITTAVSGLLRGDLESVDQSYDLGDIAILVRKNRHARPIIDDFSEAGIPFELVGDLSAESIGVETVISYLRALADPSDDVSVRRVLLMRYRLCEADLQQLAEAEDRLIDAVRSLDTAVVSEPDRLATAQEHFEHLLSRRDKLSVERLYHELLNTTDIEWFLTRTERRELKGLEELIAEYGDQSVQPSIDSEFIEYLDRHETVVEATDSTPDDQAEGASDAVSFMTVHQAKGLDFPVVILPTLTAQEWAPRAREYSELTEAVNNTEFWTTDQIKRDQQEARRLLHVGITRAEDQLILCGHSDGSATSGDGITLDDVQQWITEDIEWDLTAGSFPVWDQVLSSLPETAEEWTEEVSNTSPRRSDGVATYDGTALGYEAAIETVLQRADSLLDGALDDVDPAAIGVDENAFTTIPDPTLRRRHSYTSLGTIDDCARKHYLDHVVYAYELPSELRPSPGGGGREEGASDHSDSSEETAATNREVGVLFHETAEAAIDQGRSDREVWRTVCEQQALELGLEHALDRALECVDRFFETPVAEWELLSAEHPFGIEIDGSYVVGEIDCLARRPDGELVVLDYKATGSEKAESNRQLPLYILACEDLFEESITTAGYVYVSDIGPDVDIRTYDDARLETAKDSIREGLDAAATSSYTEYTAGDHCQWCPHNELPCSNLQTD